MKTKIIHRKIVGRINLFVLGTVVLLSSCTKNILDAVPQTTIAGSTAFSSPDKILAQVNAFYSQLESSSFYGGGFIVNNEKRGDDFSQNDGNNSTGANVWNQTITASGSYVNSVWSAAYTTINSANIFIANVIGSTLISDSVKKNYLAEAKFVRGFAYLNLVQAYAKPYALDSTSLALPLRLSPEISGGDNSLAFSSVAAVYTQIISDLNDAEAGLPVGYSTALLNVSRATKSAAIALKTRVYLIKGDYTDVIAEATKIVSATAPFQYTAGTVTHKLESNIATVFGGSYTGNEAIFSLPFVNASEAPGNQSALAYNYLYPILYLNTAAIVSDTVFSSSTSVDARKSLVKTNASGQKVLNKFSHNSVPYNDYIPVIRYAEVLLNYAEASSATGNLATATALLKAVRNRSNPNAVLQAASISTQAALSTTIFNERRIELLGEGFRLFDLLRTVQTLPAKIGNAGTAPSVLPTASNYVWPVPSGEIAYNTLAPQ